MEARQGQSHGSQQGSSSFPTGGGALLTSVIYNREKMIDNMATYISLEGLPFSYSESRNLEQFNRLSLQPAFERVSRNTLKYRIINQYYLARGNLIEYFRTFDGRIGLTVDCWISKQDESFLCIAVHWIDSSHFLQKPIIAFDVMNEFDNGYNICNRIDQTLIEFNLRNKLFTISFDNATAHTKCIEHCMSRIPSLLNGALLNVRCCAHIVNLSAEEAIAMLHPLILPVRKVVKWIRNNTTEDNLTAQKIFLDTPTKWNSTYKLLVQAIKYKDILTTLFNEFHAGKNDCDTYIDDSSWRIAQHVCNLLKAYKKAVNVFSLAREANVHLVIIECLNIVMAMSKCQLNEPCLEPIIVEMKRKWLNSFKDFPVIYGVACLLDSDIKLNGLKNMLDYYYCECLNISYDTQKYIDDCVAILIKLYDIYAQECGSSSTPVPKGTRFGMFDHIIFRRQSNVSDTSSSSIINEYLSHMHSANDADFNILSWWRKHSAQYPILAKLARDLLVVPASTVASESAFCAGRQILDEKISCLPPDFVKIFVCKKDWDQAEKRQQGEKEDDSDEEDPFMIMDTSLEGTPIADKEE